MGDCGEGRECALFLAAKLTLSCHESVNLGHVAFAAHEQRRALVKARWRDIENGAVAVARGPTRSLHDESERSVFVEQP